MDITDLDGKPFSLWLTDEAEESAVYPGVARWHGSTLFIERTSQRPFEIRAEWYERIQTVTSEEARKILLGADYFLRLYVGNIPIEADADGYEQTDLKWPD